MKALVWTEKQLVEIQNREIPDYKGKVLIKVAYAGICGSDVSIYIGKHPRAKAPLIMGHEFCGTVEAIDEGVETPLMVGDRVVVNPLYFCGRCRACLAGNTHVCRTLRLYGTDTDGGMAEYAAVPERSVLKLPDEIPIMLAALIEPVAVVVHAFRMIKKTYYGTAAVIGLGPMGLLSAIMLKNSGVRDIFCVEVNPERVKQARNLGFEVINPRETDVKEYILDKSDSEGVELVVEASGNQAAADIVTDIAGVRGEILLLSVFKEPATLDLRAVNFKEQFIIGSRVYTSLDFKDAVDYVNRHGDDLRPVISHIRSLDDGQEVFQDIISGHSNTMKVLLKV